MVGILPSYAAPSNASRICRCRTLLFLKGADFDFEVSLYSSRVIAPKVRQIQAPPVKAGNGSRKKISAPEARHSFQMSMAGLPVLYESKGGKV